MLPNQDGSLRPGMFAVATFRSRKSRPRIVVPSHGHHAPARQRLGVPKGRRPAVRRIEVHALGEIGGMQQIQQGLKPEIKIVANALDFSAAMAEQGK